MLQTLERTNIFDARVLTAAHADALRALAGPGGLPLLPCLHPALEEGQIVGDYAGQDELPPPRCCRSTPRTRCPQVCAPQATGPTDRVRC